jgi:hypothetical protein
MSYSNILCINKYGNILPTIIWIKNSIRIWLIIIINDGRLGLLFCFIVVVGCVVFIFILIFNINNNTIIGTIRCNISMIRLNIEIGHNIIHTKTIISSTT